MRKLHTLALIAALAALTTTAEAADPAKGREIFSTVGCWGCHGYNGQGGAGPKLAPDPLPPEAIAAYIRQSDKALMPPYAAKNLSDEDIGHIHAWLASQPKAPDWKQIPALAP